MKTTIKNLKILIKEALQKKVSAAQAKATFPTAKIDADDEHNQFVIDGNELFMNDGSGWLRWSEKDRTPDSTGWVWGPKLGGLKPWMKKKK